jgi:hypothetical protein
MLLSIILALGICMVLACGVLLLSPVRLSCSGESAGPENRFSLFLSWMHPSVLRCEIDPEKQLFTVIALGRYRLYSSEAGDEPYAAQSAPRTGGEARQPKGREEKPAIEKSTPPDQGRETLHHDSKEQKSQEREASRAKQEKTHVDKDEKQSEDKKEKGLFGFLRKPAVLRVMVFLRNTRWRNKILRWLKGSVLRFFHIVSVTRFRFSLRLGLSDPGQLGIAYGYFIAAKHALTDGKNSHREIIFEPVFDREIAEAQGAIEISSSLARLCLPFVLALVTFPFVHTLLLYLKARRIRDI